MLRVRQDKIKVVIEKQFDTADPLGLKNAMENIKTEIDEGLETLADVAPKYDEVTIDKSGDLHCKKYATEETADDDDS